MCGIMGIVGKQPIVELLYLGMMQLQHRGQDAAGVFLYDPRDERHFLRKNLGLVPHLFDEGLPRFPALWGIGHVRYSTSGQGNIGDAQPLVIHKDSACIAIAHNGNLVNYSSLREDLENTGALFATSCDTEAIIHVLSQNLPPKGSFFDRMCLAVQNVYERVTGAFSIIGIMTTHGMFAFRDPQGIRPLLLGKGDNLLGVASETVALSSIGCKVIEDIPPGELICIDNTGKLQRSMLKKQKHAHCCFEFNYFAKTHTLMEKKEIYTVRTKLGVALAEKIRALKVGQIDVVIPVPETGVPAAIALSQHLKIPYAEGFVRQGHVGRTFIMPRQENRECAVIQKLAPIRSVFEGKSVVLVDDSIIRGTVSKRTISLARQAGAIRIIFASTFPPVRHSCIYGIDFPNQNQLIASHQSIADICTTIGADVLVYNDIQGLKAAIGLEDLCLACLDGHYPTSTAGIEKLQQLRERALHRT